MSPLHGTLRALLTISLCAIAAGCGARSTLREGDQVEQATPVALYAPDGAGCVEELQVQTAAEVMAKKEGQSLAVVDILYATECTGLGGDYVLAREIDGFRAFWLGAHGCEFLDTVAGPGLLFGVVRYQQTAALFQISPDVCIGFPDEPPGVQTDVTTEAIAVFETLAGAQAFAASLGGAP